MSPPSTPPRQPWGSSLNLSICACNTSQHPRRIRECRALCRSEQCQKSSQRSGHSYASFSTGGQHGSMVIDLENSHGISVDASGIAQTGGDVRLGGYGVGYLQPISVCSAPWNLSRNWHRRPCESWRIWLHLSIMGRYTGYDCCSRRRTRQR